MATTIDLAKLNTYVAMEAQDVRVAKMTTYAVMVAQDVRIAKAVTYVVLEEVATAQPVHSQIMVVT